jgi:hypothetical protein
MKSLFIIIMEQWSGRPNRRGEPSACSTSNTTSGWGSVTPPLAAAPLALDDGDKVREHAHGSDLSTSSRAPHYQRLAAVAGSGEGQEVVGALQLG